jgi:hypothetical protein
LTEVPRLFHTTSGTVGLADNASHFSKVPTYKTWANSTSGLKKHIEKKLSSLKTSLRSLIAAEFGAGTIAYTRSPLKRWKNLSPALVPFWGFWTRPMSRFTCSRLSALGERGL